MEEASRESFSFEGQKALRLPALCSAFATHGPQRALWNRMFLSDSLKKLVINQMEYNFWIGKNKNKKNSQMRLFDNRQPVIMNCTVRDLVI